MSRTYNRPIDVLLLCTDNQCRSPMAEVLLRRRLGDMARPVAIHHGHEHRA